MATILVVDDDETLRELYSTMLRSAGHEVIRAEDGKKALATCGAQSVDLVLTDLLMPDMDGVELIMRLRETCPKVKIIAMSGGGLNDPEPYLSPTRYLGAQKTMVKPFSPKQLIEAVRSVLESKEADGDQST